jgi:hypothetical protein
MTQAELDAIPEEARFELREEVIDGVRYVTPIVRQAASRAVWMSDDDPMMAIDADGSRWTFGRRDDGTLVKFRG